MNIIINLTILQLFQLFFSARMSLFFSLLGVNYKRFSPFSNERSGNKFLKKKKTCLFPEGKPVNELLLRITFHRKLMFYFIIFCKSFTDYFITIYSLFYGLFLYL